MYQNQIIWVNLEISEFVSLPGAVSLRSERQVSGSIPGAGQFMIL